MPAPALRRHRPHRRRNCSAVLAHALEPRLLFAVFTPTTSAALSSALTSAQLGDTIILQAGTTYNGNFTLTDKGSGPGWITIQSSNLASLPDGVRVSPADAADMPKIVSAGSNVPAIRAAYGAAVGAHNYKLLGLEIAGPADNSGLVNLIELGTTDSVQNTLTMMPHDFVIDRCYLHANLNPATGLSTQNLRRAIALNSGATDITNCYIAECHDAGSDSQAIGGANGAGPYNIINNHLEGASENILFGGSGCYIPNTVPSDIVIRNNHFIKPLSWMGVWAVKNLLELKEGRRISITNNIFENNWNSGQDGTAILFKLDQYSASRPWQVTEDVTFNGNIVRHAANGMSLQGRDYTNNSPDGLVRRLTITNNVFEDISKTPWATWSNANAIGGNSLYLTQGPQYATFSHNTVINGRTTINADSSNLTTHFAIGFTYQNNIAAHNTYGVFSSEYGTGDGTITNYFDNHSGGTFTKDLLMGGPSNSYKLHPGNYFPAAWTNVGFTDQTNHNYALLSSSAYHNVGTDGKDLGPDFSQVVQDFAFVTGTTLNVVFNPLAPLPITLSGTGGAIVASYDQESVTFSGITAVSAVGTPGDDQLIINGTPTAPISFAAGAGNDSVHVLAGASAVIASDLSPSLKNVAVTVDAGGALTFNATQHLAGLTVSGNATLTAGGNKVLVTKSLAVAGRLDLTDGDMVLDYSGVSPVGTWNGSAYGGITGLIASGRNGGNWSGNGIVSSVTGAGNLKTLGVGESAQILSISGLQTGIFSGETVDASSVLVKFTYGGDANLDGKLNVDDYGRIDFNVSLGSRSWFNGDFNYDGNVNVDDYGILDLDVGMQGSPL